MKIELNKVTWYSIAMAIILYVGTFLIAFYLGIQVASVKFAVVEPTTIPPKNVQTQTNQTAGWQTYTNTQYGFEFQYPKGITVTNQNGNTVVIGDTRYGYSDTWDLKLYKNANSNSLEEWILSEFNSFKNTSDKDCQIFVSGQSYNDGRADVQGVKAILVIDTSDFNQTCADEGYYVMSPNKLTVVKFDGINQTSEEVTSFLFSTFKFTNQTPVPPATTNQCNIQPNAQGVCPTGCVNYGIPLGCVTQEQYQYCKTHACPI